MSYLKFLRTYIGLKTAKTMMETDIRNLRMEMTRQLGEEVQRQIIEEGNQIEIAEDKMWLIPDRMRKEYVKNELKKAIPEPFVLDYVSFLLSDIMYPVLNQTDGIQLVEEYKQLMQQKKWTIAIIKAETILAYALYDGKETVVRNCLTLIEVALAALPDSRFNHAEEWTILDWMQNNIAKLLRIIRYASVSLERYRSNNSERQRHQMNFRFMEEVASAAETRESKFLKMVAEQTGRWCGGFIRDGEIFEPCWSCGFMQMKEILSVDNLQQELETLDLTKLTSYKDWVNPVICAAVYYETGPKALDWNRILTAWLPYARHNTDFAMFVLRYFVNKHIIRVREYFVNIDINQQTRENWVTTGIKLLRESNNRLLQEALAHVMGREMEKYKDIFEKSIEEARSDSKLEKTLTDAGVIPMKDGQYQQKRTELPHRIPHSDSDVPYEKLLRLGPRYFGAIRRNDIKAVKAMTGKGVVLSVKDEEGRTPLEYAKELEHEELIAIIEAATPKQKKP